MAKDVLIHKISDNWQKNNEFVFSPNEPGRSAGELCSGSCDRNVIAGGPQKEDASPEPGNPDRRGLFIRMGRRGVPVQKGQWNFRGFGWYNEPAVFPDVLARGKRLLKICRGRGRKKSGILIYQDAASVENLSRAI